MELAFGNLNQSIDSSINVSVHLPIFIIRINILYFTNVYCSIFTKYGKLHILTSGRSNRLEIYVHRIYKLLTSHTNG